jgi:hypothetical protein
MLTEEANSAIASGEPLGKIGVTNTSSLEDSEFLKPIKEALTANADESSVTADELLKSVNQFCSWLRRSGNISYDPYDLFGTTYGRWARQLYYDKHPLGTALNAPLILMEILAPGLRSLFVDKERFATADAQLALAFINLQQMAGCENRASLETDEHSHLLQARKLAEALLSQSISGYSGQCWGYPFDWQNVNGLMAKDTPHITATPYCYEAFAKLFDLTGDMSYLDVARSVSVFVDQDLNDTPTGVDSAAGSYTPYDQSKVVNASAYRAFILFDAARRFNNDSYFEKAWKNLRFILQAQQQDGSWLYAIDNPPEAFIDHFHTCFVLKNLYKINYELRSEDVREALHRGYSYYRKALFAGNGMPRSFAISPRLQIVRLEMYNMAEAINLGSLLKDEIPEAFTLAQWLAARLVRQYQVPAGYWVTRVYFGGIRHTVPFMRWPQSQIFHALTNLLRALQ